MGFRGNQKQKRERERSLPLWIDGGSAVLHRRQSRNRASRGKERGVLTFEDYREKERERSENGADGCAGKGNFLKAGKHPKRLKKHST
jgi:hypothetical protein